MPLKNVTSRFSMERIKSTTAYPIAADVKAGEEAVVFVVFDSDDHERSASNSFFAGRDRRRELATQSMSSRLAYGSAMRSDGQRQDAPLPQSCRFRHDGDADTRRHHGADRIEAVHPDAQPAARGRAGPPASASCPSSAVPRGRPTKSRSSNSAKPACRLAAPADGRPGRSAPADRGGTDGSPGRGRGRPARRCRCRHRPRRWRRRSPGSRDPRARGRSSGWPPGSPPATPAGAPTGPRCWPGRGRCPSAGANRR